MATTEIIRQRINALSAHGDARELQFLLNAIVDVVRALALKLDSDAGVTDTTYTALVDSVIQK
jgi:hypothetical protein